MVLSQVQAQSVTFFGTHVRTADPWHGGTVPISACSVAFGVRTQGVLGLSFEKSELRWFEAVQYQSSPPDPIPVWADNRKRKESTTQAPPFDLERGLRHAIHW